VADQLTSLKLLDLSDRELLLVLRDVADGEGYAAAADIAERLGLGGDHPHRSVSVRLSWLKRYGAVEREHERDAKTGALLYRGTKPVYTQRWKMNDIGLAMATGTLTKTQESALDRLKDGQMLMTMRWLSQRVVASDPTVGKLMDREYRYGIGRK
jgi:DNA-binding transcriptional ArsR family regulator